jgi:hypothetical protein
MILTYPVRMLLDRPAQLRGRCVARRADDAEQRLIAAAATNDANTFHRESRRL